MQGKIKNLRDSFGFIEVEGREKDLFFHMSESSQFEGFSVGDKVEFELGTGRRGDTVAVTVEKIEQ